MHLSAGSLPVGMDSLHQPLLRTIRFLPGWITASWRGLEVDTRVDEELYLALSMSQETPEGFPVPLLLPNFFCPHPGGRHSEGSDPLANRVSSYLPLTPWFLILASCSLGSLDA